MLGSKSFEVNMNKDLSEEFL